MNDPIAQFAPGYMTLLDDQNWTALLVVCDDHSTDGTPAILEEFRRTAPFPVNVLINPKQMGYVGNFEQLVGMCDGDVILLSDHDDVWLPEKLAEHEAVYRSRPEVGMAFSDGTIVGSDLAPLSLSRMASRPGPHRSRAS
jgi:glycosyltransferase involved in cell wall biosynthesis